MNTQTETDPAGAGSPLERAYQNNLRNQAQRRELAAAHARIAVLEKAMGVTPGAPPSRPTPAATAAPENLDQLWQAFAAAGDDASAAYDLALRINAATLGQERPLSISSADGRKARIDQLTAELEDVNCPRQRGKLAFQLSALCRGSAPEDPSYGLSSESIEARREVIQGRLDRTKCPVERASLARSFPRHWW